MKTLTTTYKNSIVGKQVLTLANCWKVILQDGTKLGFTTHTRDVSFSGDPDAITYKSSGFTPTASSKSSAMNVDNLDIDLLIDSSVIKNEDLETGKWNNAKVYIFRFNWALPKPYLFADIEQVLDGTIGEITRKDGKFTAEFRSKTQALQTHIIDVYKASCSADFCDTKCGLDINTYTFTDTVVSSTNNLNIVLTDAIQDDGFFNNGLVEFTSGLNTGLKMEVKNWTLSTKTIELQLPLPYNIAIGDTLKVIQGCNKAFSKCVEFNNAVNYRGFPHIPGLDFLATGKQ